MRHESDRAAYTTRLGIIQCCKGRNTQPVPLLIQKSIPKFYDTK